MATVRRRRIRGHAEPRAGFYGCADVCVPARRVLRAPEGGHMYIGVGTLVIILIIIILILIF